ncbi:PREDICTED: CCR4-NOT transcription complex subunit 3-like [Nicrophorus vespilloides]|uniref:CCR4-NOT transcription complex subunit 3-like n=1 Tax=Nicrophorus vespilloides TaxID=110193 RepID=A0ABM1NJ57_NICVS|nr:PREDICTED: CCR4-NOT transcription complex subunit 3-like [Nicrophorus vespilloides]
MSFNSFEPACKEYCRGLSPQAKAAIQKRKDEAAAAAAASAPPPAHESVSAPPTAHEPETSPAAKPSAVVPPAQSAASVPTTKSAGGISETKSAGDGAAATSVGSNRSGVSGKSGGSVRSGGSTAHDGATAQGAPTTSPSKSAKAGDPAATQSQKQRNDSIISDSYSFVEGEGEDLDLNAMFMDMLKHPYTKKILAAAALFLLGVKLARELDFLYMPLRIYDPLKSDALGRML